MNLILLTEADFHNSNIAVLGDARRVNHITDIHRAQVGEKLKVGLLGGNIGTAVILSMTAKAIELEVTLDRSPPEPSSISLILALPRPQMLKRTLQNISALGIKQLILLQSSRVEKSYWQTPQLHDHLLRESLLLGLEQSGDTVLPDVHFAKRFRPFMEDQLPTLLQDGQRGLIAHPYATAPCPYAVAEKTWLCIGPEGGFINKEIEQFIAGGFAGVTLGPRILRVETAVPYLLGRLSSH